MLPSVPMSAASLPGDALPLTARTHLRAAEALMWSGGIGASTSGPPMGGVGDTRTCMPYMCLIRRCMVVLNM